MFLLWFYYYFKVDDDDDKDDSDLDEEAVNPEKKEEDKLSNLIEDYKGEIFLTYYQVQIIINFYFRILRDIQ